jgi:hypothetical protein
MRCIHPLRNDFASIAAVAPALRQSANPNSRRAVFVQPHLLSIFLSDDSTRRNQPAHEAGSVAAFLVPDENRSVAVADVFVDGEMEVRKQRLNWLEIGE